MKMSLEVDQMLLLGIATFPGTSAVDFARKVVEIVTTNPYPDYIKRNYYFKFGGDGGTLYTIFYI